ncbi:MAG: AEC family transporter [Solobacterium sp.]|nr:AEC family transporter [Solobacterium sp.]
MTAILLGQQIAQLFLIMFLGYLIVKAGLLSSKDSKSLSILIVYIICPCTILNAFQIEYSAETAGNFLLAVASAVIIHIVVFLFTYILDRFFHFTSVEKASVIYSNAGNLIIPLVTALLGEDWVLYASAFMVVQLFIIWTHGKSLIEGKRGADMKAILTNVNLMACALGLVMFLLHVKLPALVGNTVRSLGSTVGPLSMLMLGMILAGVDIGAMVRKKRIWTVSLIRMIVMPALVLTVMKFSGLAKLSPEGVTILFISLMATMTPSATTVTQMAQLYDNDVDTATGINTITTLMCIATMPLMTMLYYL